MEPKTTSAWIWIGNCNLFLLLLLLGLTITSVGGYRQQQPPCSWLDSSSLRCFVRPGHHNLIVEESVAGRGPEHAKSLWVNCEDGGGTSPEGAERHTHALHYLHSPPVGVGVVGGGYVLSDGVFMSVKNLLDLRFEACLISGITPGAFDYFPHLQNFTLHAATAASKTSLQAPSTSTAPPAHTLSIKDTFRSLHKLQRLDLATTTLSIPSDFLCLLPGSLTHLNLSATSLRDLRGISPSDPTTVSHCGHQLVSLDLSSNFLTLLPPATFSSLGKLEELVLDRNSLTTVAERALLGLGTLNRLSLVGNSIKSLAPQFFKDNRHLQEILLQNNSLSIIAPGLFTGLEYLYHLDLSHNQLTSDWINGDTFRGLRSLSYLSLAHNQLTRLDAALFRDLTALQVLILSHNQFKVITPAICGGSGGHASDLRFLALDNNKIGSVSDEAFANCSRIEDLNLSGNRLTTVPNSLSTLIYLRYIDLGENNITNITGASYQRLHNLNGLRLTDNAIASVGVEDFRHLTSLKIVNLAKNNISTVEPGTFDHNLNLQALRLDSNRIRLENGGAGNLSMGRLVGGLRNLLWLSLNENQLTELNYEELPPKLQWIELRGNQIRSVTGSVEASRSRVTKLDLSDNFLHAIGSAQLPDSLVQLSLRNNSITTVQPYTFLLKENISLIDLSHNRLTNLDQNALRLNGVLEGPRGASVEVLLAGNEFVCDCSMQWLQDVHDTREYYSDFRYPVIADEIKCGSANPLGGSGGAGAGLFLCKYESRCLPSCHCCGFQCDCEAVCPDSCSCYNDQSWGTNIVDCSNLQYKTIPAKIPVDLTELRLDGSILPTLEANSFFPHKYLKALYLNSSQIETLANKSFHGLHQLTVLHLENNFIERLEGAEFSGLGSLEELYLQQNSLEYIANETFSGLSRLRVLWLQQNNFVTVRVWEVITPRIGRLAELRLSGSDYSCDCEYFIEFRNWLIQYGTKVSDVSEVQCVDTVSSSHSSSSSVGASSGSSSNVVNKSELLIVKLLEDRNPKCGGPESAEGGGVGAPSGGRRVHHHHRQGSSSAGSSDTNLSVLERPSDSSEEGSGPDLVIPLVLGAVGLAVLVLVLALLSLYWRDSLQIWFHANCGLRLHPEPTEDKLFDAFISYSSKDEAWVRQVLASELERHSPPYRLCLRYRDIPIPGSGSYLADTLVSAFEASRRTILVLSHHFLKGEWNRIEVKSAHAQLFKDATAQGRARVLILVLGDLPPNMDPEIRSYLKTHRKNTIHCDDKRFWDKLHYAMPDVKMKVPLLNGHAHAHQRSLPHTHAHAHTHTHSHSGSSDGSGAGTGGTGSCSLYNNSTGNYCSTTTTSTTLTRVGAGVDGGGAPFDPLGHAYSTLQQNPNHSHSQLGQSPNYAAGAAGNYNHGQSPYAREQHPHPHLHTQTYQTMMANQSHNASHSPSNMIVCPNLNSLTGTGSNRTRHVAIHI